MFLVHIKISLVFKDLDSALCHCHSVVRKESHCPYIVEDTQPGLGVISSVSITLPKGREFRVGSSNTLVSQWVASYPFVPTRRLSTCLTVTSTRNFLLLLKGSIIPFPTLPTGPFPLF